MNNNRKIVSKFKIKAALATIILIFFTLSAFTVQPFEKSTIELISNHDDMIPPTFSEPEFREYSTSDDRLVFKVSFSEPNISEYDLSHGTFSMISMPHTFIIGSDPGNPVFPVFPLQILLPYKKDISALYISPGELIEIEKHKQNLQQRPIFPFQEPVPLRNEPNAFVFNIHAYQSSDTYPNEIYHASEVEHCRGYPILTLNIFPTEYEPKNNKLSYYTDVTIYIELKDTDSQHTMFRFNQNDAA